MSYGTILQLYLCDILHHDIVKLTRFEATEWDDIVKLNLSIGKFKIITGLNGECV